VAGDPGKAHATTGAAGVAVPGAAVAPSGARGATSAEITTAPPANSAAVACAACSTSNEADALFCKKCGRRMRDEALA
jgi:hypothetical protein